jgi:hypothetical protein
LTPIDTSVRMRATGAVGYGLQREPLSSVSASCSYCEGRFKQRWSSGGVGVAVRGVGAHDAGREPFISGVEHAVAETDAGLSLRAGECMKPGSYERGSPRDASTRGEVIAGRSQRCGHSRITRENKSERCIWKYLRLLAFNQGLQLVELWTRPLLCKLKISTKSATPSRALWASTDSRPVAKSTPIKSTPTSRRYLQRQLRLQRIRDRHRLC